MLAISSQFLLAGCQGAEATAKPAPRDPAVASPGLIGAPAPPPPMAFAAPPGPRQVSRTIEDDPDADGIADYRVVLTDSFDEHGNLVSTTRSEDFEADGIFDARSTTYLRD